MDTAVSGHAIALYQHWSHVLSITKNTCASKENFVCFYMGFSSTLGLMSPLVSPLTSMSGTVLLWVLLVPVLAAQTLNGARQDTALEPGIPVTDPLVKAKCGTCHPADEHGNMDRISWVRTTPEGWQEAIKKMILEKRVELTPVEARSMVQYLSSSHGLAPEEAKPVMYYPERRVHDEIGVANDYPLAACAKCHAAARLLSWRRSADEWKRLGEEHFAQYKVARNETAMAAVRNAAPLHTPEWTDWSARSHASNLTGRWLVTAHLPGHGRYFGELQVERGATPDEFNTRATLHSINDGSTVIRIGQMLLFSGYAWRGRSHGVAPSNSSTHPDDPGHDAREVLWISPDQTTGEGRWFWGQYQEFGFDVVLRRASPGITLLAVDRLSLKVGAQASSLRVMGENLPTDVNAGEVSVGPGITVRRVISSTSREIVAEVEVSATAVPGKRDITLRGAVLRSALAVYDRVDYVKVTPESSMAAFGDQTYARGYQQFEAIGYQRVPDGKPHTADDLELGPMDASWSMQVFYAVDASGNDKIGNVSPAGLLTPAPRSPGGNFDIWVIATAVNERNQNGRPLAGKGYVVVTIPAYSFDGRRYVRDLDRWIEEGTW